MGSRSGFIAIENHGRLSVSIVMLNAETPHGIPGRFASVETTRQAASCVLPSGSVRIDTKIATTKASEPIISRTVELRGRRGGIGGLRRK
jgi:hypothetical protein